MATQTALMTFAEFERMSEPREGHYELHHGLLIHMPPRKKGHVRVQQALLNLLMPPARGKGFVTNEFPFRPSPEYEAWQADVAFVTKDRWDRDDSDYFAGAPDLVIEVLSKSNTMDEILERQQTCLAHGCVSFWTVDPVRRMVLVTDRAGVTVTYGESSEAPLPPELGGSIAVGSIFA